MEKITVTVPQTVEDAIEAELGYGEHKTEWIRDAILLRFIVDNADDLIADHAGQIDAFDVDWIEGSNPQ